MTPMTAYIALGSNLGDRQGTMQRALAAINRLECTTLVKVSSIVETPPMGQPGQRDYLNAAACIRTQLPPGVLLMSFLRIEAANGRRRSPYTRWGSRELDIDLLLYDQLVINEPGLTVPHPHMHERDFVLGPLAEIAPQLVHPVLKKTVLELLNMVTAASGAHQAPPVVAKTPQPPFDL